MAYNPALAQAQVRQNSEELARYLSELQSWETTIKAKERALQAGEITLTKQSKSSPRQPSSVTLTDTSASDAQLFDAKKRAGNNHFQGGRWSEAAQCYSQCIILKPDDSIPYANRAAAYLKLERYADAIHDCDRALIIDPGSVKALFRRATARKMLAKFSDAVSDCREVVRIEPNNKAAQNLLAELESTSSTPTAAAREASVAPAIATAATVPPRRKLVIQETEDDDEGKDTNDATPPPQRRSDAVTQRPVPPIASVNGAGITAQPPPAAPHKSSTLSSEPSPMPPSSSSAAPATTASAVAARIPRSAMEFESAYRSVRMDPSKLHALLAMIDPTKFPVLLKSALDSSMMTNFVTAIESSGSGDEVVGVNWRVLSSLTRVQRFELVRGFLSAKELRVIHQTFETARANAGKIGVEAQQIDEIERKYPSQR